MKSLMTIRKNAKALSPVVASIILIAVTVAVSVAVAAWMGGMTVGLMGSAEQVAVTNIGFSTTPADTITVTVQNTGDTAVTIQNVFVNGVSIPLAAGDIVVLPSPSPALSNPNTIPKGSTGTLTLTGTDITLTPGTAYQVKLVTAKGNSIAGSATYNNPT